MTHANTQASYNKAAGPDRIDRPWQKEGLDDDLPRQELLRRSVYTTVEKYHHSGQNYNDHWGMLIWPQMWPSFGLSYVRNYKERLSIRMDTETVLTLSDIVVKWCVCMHNKKKKKTECGVSQSSKKFERKAIRTPRPSLSLSLCSIPYCWLGHKTAPAIKATQ